MTRRSGAGDWDGGGAINRKGPSGGGAGLGLEDGEFILRHSEADALTLDIQAEIKLQCRENTAAT